MWNINELQCVYWKRKRLSPICTYGDNIWHLFAFISNGSLLKQSLIYKKRVCIQEQTFLFRVDPIDKERKELRLKANRNLKNVGLVVWNLLSLSLSLGIWDGESWQYNVIIFWTIFMLNKWDSLPRNQLYGIWLVKAHNSQRVQVKSLFLSAVWQSLRCKTDKARLLSDSEDGQAELNLRIVDVKNQIPYIDLFKLYRNNEQKKMSFIMVVWCQLN